MQLCIEKDLIKIRNKYKKRANGFGNSPKKVSKKKHLRNLSVIYNSVDGTNEQSHVTLPHIQSRSLLRNELYDKNQSTLGKYVDFTTESRHFINRSKVSKLAQIMAQQANYS